MQWDVDCPTFTEICNLTINWFEYGSSFSGIQMDYFDRLSASWKDYWSVFLSFMQNQQSSYSVSSSRNTDESCHSGVWLFMIMHQRTSHWLLSKLSATVNLFNEPFCLQSRLGPQWYFLIRNLKYRLRDDESLKITVEAWFERQEGEFYFQGINSL